MCAEKVPCDGQSILGKEAKTMKKNWCKDCGTKKNLTKHHIFGKDYQHKIIFCWSCHKKRHEHQLPTFKPKTESDIYW